MTEGHHERWALVTGASAGIGKAFADLLAENGFNLVLTARRAERLEKHGAELEKRWGGKTFVVTADLSEPSAVDKIFKATEEAGITIDFLVNNAGFGVPGHFEDVPWADHAKSNQVMVASVVHLTHLCLSNMRAKGYGRIINVSSLAAHMPGSAGHTLYAAQKAYLVKFSESLWAEHYDLNINCTALCPGFTYSEFHDVTGNRKEVSDLPKYMWMDAKTVAEQGYAAVLANKPVYINGGWNKFLAALTRFLPKPISYAIIRRMSSRIRRQEV